MNMREPSVYDFIRSLFHSEITIDIRDFVDIKKAEIPRMLINNKEKPALETKNWKIFTGTIAAIFAQTFLEPDSFHIEFAILLYLVALLLVWRGMQAGEFNPQPKILNQKKKYNLALKKYPFIISVALLTTSFILFSSNSINWINLFLWISGIVFMVIAFWNPKVKEPRTSKKPDKLFLAIALCTFIIILFLNS